MAAFNRLMKIVGAWGVWTMISFCYDYLLYPILIWKFGSIMGGGVMTLGSIVICSFVLYGYERSGSDWFGVNVVEVIKNDGNRWIKELDARADRSSLWFCLRIILFPFSRSFLFVLWAIKKNDLSAFFFLSIFKDPFITTIFLRHGRFDGLRKRDWAVFTCSVIVSNGYWVLRTTIMVVCLKYGVRHIGS